jgi:N-glycosylase/DNA lyase
MKKIVFRRKDKIAELLRIYEQKKPQITQRLKDFEAVWDKDDREIFAELCFCILTPQSKALVCDQIMTQLKKSGLLYKGSLEQIKPYVKRARFYKNKSGYIVAARNALHHAGSIRIKDKIDRQNTFEAREWLVKNIKGIGYKEASHFLRNIGMGENLAILDIHILRNLTNLSVIRQVPKTLTKSKYLLIENKLRRFAQQNKIPLAHIDLLFWSMSTGHIFK